MDYFFTLTSYKGFQSIVKLAWCSFSEIISSHNNVEISYVTGKNTWNEAQKPRVNFVLIVFNFTNAFDFSLIR